MPRFKTGWDPDAQLGRDVLGQFCLVRREQVATLGGIRPDRGRHIIMIYTADSPIRLHRQQSDTSRKFSIIVDHPFLKNGSCSIAASAATRSPRLVAQSAASNLCGQRWQSQERHWPPLSIECIGPSRSGCRWLAFWCQLAIQATLDTTLSSQASGGVLQETDYPPRKDLARRLRGAEIVDPGIVVRASTKF